jgi:serine/threonine protein kinase
MSPFTELSIGDWTVGEHKGCHFIALGLVDGGNLAESLATQPLLPRVAAEVMENVAEAIAHAHENDVIHRDLKPANILLDKSGNPHVTDFGLANRLGADSSLTDTGRVMGTPPYMSPEQAQGLKVGTSSDIYSLGAILYCSLIRCRERLGGLLRYYYRDAA